MNKSITHLGDLTPDPENARAHNPRNVGMIEDALREVGAARSGVIDENGVILAGNATWEALAAAGIERVKVVEADGNEWVVVQRSGLTEQQKRRLALVDNRAAELASWNPEVLRAIAESEPQTVEGLFTPYEMAALIGNPGWSPDDPNAEWLGMPEFAHENKMAFREIIVRFKDGSSVEAFAVLLGRTITGDTKSIWYPDDGLDRIQMRYEDES